jgi:AraC-like DNA-binding protein
MNLMITSIFRIEAVKISLSNGEHKKSTLLGIAYDCGFNSKATLTELFKKTLAKLRKNTPTNKVSTNKKATTYSASNRSMVFFINCFS